MVQTASSHHPTFANYEITRCKPSGASVRLFDEVPTEHVLDVLVNGEKMLSVSCTPSDLVELSIGRLLTEGLIESMEDVVDVVLDEDSRRVRIILKKSMPICGDQAWQAVSTCTSKGVPQGLVSARTPLGDVSPIPWKAGDIFSLASDFAVDTPIHRATFGSHSCRLAVGGRLLYCCEDLGRHNAFDKAVGCALLEGVDLTQATLYTSGRAPVDMVEKAIRARVPILVSKAVPTNRTVELARRFGLTLICSARPDSMKVFSDPLGCAYRAATA